MSINYDAKRKRWGRRRYRFTTCGLAVILLLLLAICVLTRLAMIGGL